MSFAEQLLYHANDILPRANGDAFEYEVRMRRAVSAPYYSLFHLLNEDAVRIIAPNISAETNHRMQQWFEHAKTKEICGRFLKPRLEQPLLSLIGEHASQDLQTVCRNFIALQDARHSADYDLGYHLDLTEASRYLVLAVDATDA